MDDDPIPKLKRQLAAELVRVMDGWPQANAAARMRTHPPRVADLRHGRLGRFSVESLVRFLTRLRHQVVFTVVSDHELWRQAAVARARAKEG
ncbi:MAG: XRE family transcriptional regulator [Gemmatimonadaceae bacterium]